ncbi:serine/threonine-protein kinase [Vitiosangium sp. GDMCC 1.1324]|uniref:serine/threonine protein kinase n=1 Tax=Vitiosangium sp. (strain GDMCC 1.1324) TaxID=2138576 RepID=UPI000D3C04FB|nr:serine/threonine-protein kinase [Vitiosangium sp. GDMCC 1.1324]PTL80910.1 hypothetical protein DAT35_26630 [Vitiosangium sp. GDMCC 1.1324]
MLDERGGQVLGAMPWAGLPPGTEVAGFTIEGLLASGSFGAVYRAKRGDRLFALKLVRINPRSNREVDALRLMRHPNVVCFHGFGFWPDQGRDYLVLALELVEGRPLDVWAEEENPSALELVLQVLLPLALTLADVHAAGVVHRDLKEANIVMREADRQPVLVDFGAAGIEGAQRLTMRMPPGTAEYRSPELWRFAREWEGEPYPFKPGDDLWAMGVITYFLLTRTLPFGDRNSPGMLRAILEETPRAPNELNPRVPPALSELCMRMLEKEPEARYADAMALAEALSAEWAQADSTWRVPLFPGARRDKSPPPVSTPPELPSPRRWWVAGLALAAVMMVLCLLATWRWWPMTVQPSIQLTESPPPSPPRQAILRQEVAPAKLTGEVGHGAAPDKSSTPAPVATATNSEDSKMTRSKKTRALVAAGCVAGSACAGGPQLRQPPKPEECPAGAAATHERFGLLRDSKTREVTFIPSDQLDGEDVPVREGEATVFLEAFWGKVGPHEGFRNGTALSGRFYFGTGRVYGRFTKATLPSGEVVPVCFELLNYSGLGVEMRPGSTRNKVLVFPGAWVQVSTRFQ